MKIVILGAPGVGKGTYTSVLIKKIGLVHISTGDIFREQVKKGTSLGTKARQFMDAGKLVPDEITIGMIKERLAQDDLHNGFILDGFPRTVPQAEALASMTDIDAVLNIVADRDIIIQRLSGRRLCRKCGHIFHVQNIPPKVEGICDYCGSELYQRDDDKPEAITKRLQEYEEKTAPLIVYYTQKGLLREVTANEDFKTHGDKIIRKLMKAIESARRM